MKSLPGAKSIDGGPEIMHLPVREGVQYGRLMGLGEVSVLGLGCARLGSLTEPRSRRESLSLIAAAVTAGITLFDTADIYALRRERTDFGTSAEIH
jgi:aryl-alcohol dehydrogenase-like predicted oxidoreductase